MGNKHWEKKWTEIPVGRFQAAIGRLFDRLGENSGRVDFEPTIYARILER